MVVVATFQTAAGSAVIDEVMELSERPSEVEAVSTVAFVFALITAASDEEAVCTLVLVFAFTTAAIELEAVCTSSSVARLPEVSPAPVSVRVPEVQTSAASVPKPVSVREPAAQTFAGIEVMDEAMVESVEPSEVEAVSTVAFVLVFITAARDEEAVCTTVFVLLFMTAAKDE